MKEIAEEIITWLRKKQEQSGTSGFVLGLSGGIDSSVAAGLITKACPGHCLGVIMPAGNRESDKEDAVKAADAFGLPYIEISLGTYRENLFADVKNALKERNAVIGDEPMTKGNIGARLRMTTLYAVGNSLSAGCYCGSGTCCADALSDSHSLYFRFRFRRKSNRRNQRQQCRNA